MRAFCSARVPRGTKRGGLTLPYPLRVPAVAEDADAVSASASASATPTPTPADVAFSAEELSALEAVRARRDQRASLLPAARLTPAAPFRPVFATRAGP